MALEREFFSARTGRLSAFTDPEFGAGGHEPATRLLQEGRRAEPGSSGPAPTEPGRATWPILTGVRAFSNRTCRSQLAPLTTSHQPPRVDGLHVPQVWSARGQCSCGVRYLDRAAKAAAPVHGEGLTAAAEQQLKPIGASC